MKKKFTKFTIYIFLCLLILFMSFLSIYHKYYEFLFFALVVFAISLFFSRKKVDEKSRDLKIEPKIAREMAKKIISDAKKHRFDRDL